MTKAERTRLFILEKTAPIFNSKGFNGTSLSDLTEATGLTKGSLYGNFRDKEEISLEAFRYSIGRVKDMMKQALAGAVTFKHQLELMLDFFTTYATEPPVPGGCPLLNGAVESDDSHSALRVAVTKEIMSTVNFITTLLEGGIKNGEFKSGINPHEIAYVLFCSIEGAVMFSRVEDSREPMDIIIGHCRKILEQITAD